MTLARRGRAQARPSRAADREPELADRADDPRDVPVHRLRGDAVRLVLHGVLLRARRQPGRLVDLAAAAVRVPEVRRRRQHRDPRHLELHDALGPAVDQAQQPPRPAGGSRADDPDGNGVPADPVHRVRARRVQHERRRVRLGLLRPHRPPRRPRLRRPDAAHDRGRAGVPGPLLARAPSRRRAPGDLLALRRRHVDRRVRRPSICSESRSSEAALPSTWQSAHDGRRRRGSPCATRSRTRRRLPVRARHDRLLRADRRSPPGSRPGSGSSSSSSSPSPPSLSLRGGGRPRRQTHHVDRAAVEDTRRILVVANETLEGARLHEEIVRMADGVAEDVLVVCPALNSHLRTWFVRRGRRPRGGGGRLRSTLADLRPPASTSAARSATATHCRRSRMRCGAFRQTRS